MPDDLFHDLKAMQKLSQDLVPATELVNILKVKAMERGTRRHPDGVVEEYQRLELDSGG